MSKPTQKDAELLMRLYELGHSPDMYRTWEWVMMLKEQTYEDFIKENPMGSEGFFRFHSICGFYEMVGILLKYGAMNEDMVMDFHSTVWNKLGPIVKGLRKEFGSQRLFENYEWLAKRKAEWVKEHPPVFPQ